MSNNAHKLSKLTSFAERSIKFLPILSVVGYLIVGYIYSEWGIDGQNLAPVQWIPAAVWFCLFYALAFVPSFLGYKLAEKMQRVKTPYRKTARSALLVVGMSAVAAVWVPQLFFPSRLKTFGEHHRQFFTRHLISIELIFIFSIVSALVIPLYEILRDSYKKPNVFGIQEIEERHPTFSVWLALCMACLGILLFRFVYPIIPMRFGGIRPEYREVWLDKEALPLVEACGKVDQKTVDRSGFIFVKGLYFVRESSSSVFFVSNNPACSTALELSKDLVKSSHRPFGDTVR